jgi:serine/threonine-protein kinase RsbW
MGHQNGGPGDPRRRVLADESAISSMRSLLRRDLADAGADPDVQFDCLVAVTEACTNALVHGRGDAIAHVSWRIEGSIARVLVEDYSRQRWTPAGGNGGAAGPRIGGFGLQLMRDLMDRVNITIEERGTTVELAKRIC